MQLLIVVVRLVGCLMFGVFVTVHDLLKISTSHFRFYVLPFNTSYLDFSKYHFLKFSSPDYVDKILLIEICIG